jgi:hypothetical protein
MQTPGAAGTQVGLPELRIKKPISGRPEIGAQFQLWIFSYTNSAPSSKKCVSRVMIYFTNSFALILPRALWRLCREGCAGAPKPH